MPPRRAHLPQTAFVQRIGRAAARDDACIRRRAFTLRGCGWRRRAFARHAGRRYDTRSAGEAAPYAAAFARHVGTAHRPSRPPG
ncbi:hypothetical protein CRM91_11250 [Burkholderia ambifaria]|nr:hypothetical protein CRM91_11250 [Burkholderia ambifaria]